MGQIVSKAMIWLPRALAGLLVAATAAACSSSSSQAAGDDGGEDVTLDTGDDVATADAPANDGAPQTCPCGAAFKTCPASRPCVVGTTTEPSCAGMVCCGPASDCDGGADSGARDAARDAAPDARGPDAAKGPDAANPPDAAKDAKGD